MSVLLSRTADQMRGWTHVRNTTNAANSTAIQTHLEFRSYVLFIVYPAKTLKNVFSTGSV